MWWGTQRRSAGRRSTTSPGPKRPSAAISTARSSRGGKSWSRPWQSATPKQTPGLHHQHRYMGGSTCRTLECHYYLHVNSCEIKTFDLSVHRETHCLKNKLFSCHSCKYDTASKKILPIISNMSRPFPLLGSTQKKEGQGFYVMTYNEEK